MEIVGAARPSGGGSAEPLNSSVGRSDERRRLVEGWCAAHSVAEILQTLMAAGIPVAPVRGIPEVTKDKHTWEREMLAKRPDALAGEIHVPGLAVKMSATPGRVGPVPSPGEHTDEILTALLGYDAAQLKSLREAKVIA
jgi:crotonobetainyl-CoA:carnitine CoA-transferase CaiB-like acyl-CoA transferase